MIIRRNTTNQTVEVGPLLIDGVAVDTAVASIDGIAAGAVSPTGNGCFRYTFSQEETNRDLVRLKLTAGELATHSWAFTFATTSSRLW